MDDEKLNKNGLIRVWLKIWTLLKLLVGDVDVEGKGDLQTQIDNLDSRVEECFRNASDGKELIADAVTGRGVLTKASDTFATIAANIAKIAGAAKLQSKTAVLSNVEQTIKPDTGYDGLGQVSVPAVKGTAGTGDVLTGKTFSGTVGIEKAGTMPNNGAWTGDTTDNGNVAIPAGYHNGQGYVSGAGAYAKGMEAADARTNTDSANYKNGYSAGVTATKKGTAAAGDVLTGKTFTNASSVGAAGTMANKGATTVDAGAVSQDDTYTYLTVPAAGFYNTNSKLRTENSNIRVKKVLLGSVHSIADKTFNLTSYPGYKTFTNDNFGFSAPTETYMGQSVSGETHGQYSYNSSNGVLTVYKNHRATSEVVGITNVYYVYLYYVSNN